MQEVAELLDLTLAVLHSSAWVSQLTVTVTHSSVIFLVTVALTLLKYALVSLNYVHFVNLDDVFLFSYLFIFCKRWIK